MEEDNNRSWPFLLSELSKKEPHRLSSEIDLGKAGLSQTTTGSDLEVTEQKQQTRNKSGYKFSGCGTT